VEETTDDWGQESTPVSVTAKLEYRVDSLMNENRRMEQQVEALATENRNLTARAAELETKLAEAAAAPPPPAMTSPSTGDMTSGYSDALASYRRRDFSTAAQQFEGLLSGGIRDDLADNCHYWIGESYYGMRQYADAITHFQMVFNYAKSEKKDDAQLMIGNSYAAAGNTSSARDAYTSMVSSYPASPLVKKAQEKLARLK
jgi:tol-pal system protein YbgF